jgi:hypothetical protein
MTGRGDRANRSPNIFDIGNPPGAVFVLRRPVDPVAAGEIEHPCRLGADQRAPGVAAGHGAGSSAPSNARLTPRNRTSGETQFRVTCPPSVTDPAAPGAAEATRLFRPVLARPAGGAYVPAAEERGPAWVEMDSAAAWHTGRLDGLEFLAGGGRSRMHAHGAKPGDAVALGGAARCAAPPNTRPGSLRYMPNEPWRIQRWSPRARYPARCR